MLGAAVSVLAEDLIEIKTLSYHLFAAVGTCSKFSILALKQLRFIVVSLTAAGKSLNV